MIRTEVLAESRLLTRSVVLEKQIGAAVEGKPPYILLTSARYKTEEEARAAFDAAVKQRRKRYAP